MNIFIKILLTILLALSMGVAPTFGSDKCGINTDEYMKNLYNQCLSESSKTWDEDLCRCVTKSETISQREANVNCAAYPDEAQRKQCYEAVAKQEGISDTSLDTGINENLLKVYEIVNIITGALGGGSESKCFSMKIAKYTGLASTAGTLYSYFKIDDEAAKVREDFEKMSLSADSYQAQMQVFEFLKKEQDAIKDIAKFKHKLHMATAAGYTASSAYAIAESFSLVNTACGTKVGDPVPATDQEEKMKDGEESTAETTEEDKVAANDKATRDENKMEGSTDGSSSDDQAKANHDQAVADKQELETNKENLESDVADNQAEINKARNQQANLNSKKAQLTNHCRESFNGTCANGSDVTLDQTKAGAAKKLYKVDTDSEGNLRQYIETKDGKNIIAKTTPDGQYTIQEFEIVKDERGLDSMRGIGEEVDASWAARENGAYYDWRQGGNSHHLHNVEQTVSLDNAIEANQAHLNSLLQKQQSLELELGYTNDLLEDHVIPPYSPSISSVVDNKDVLAQTVSSGLEPTKVIPVDWDPYSVDGFWTNGAIKVAESTVRQEDLDLIRENSSNNTTANANEAEFDYVASVNKAHELEKEALSPSLTSAQRKSKLLEARVIWIQVINRTNDEELKTKYESKVEYIDERVQMIDNSGSYSFNEFLRGSANLFVSILFTESYAVDSTGSKLKKLGMGAVKSSLISLGVTELIRRVAPQFGQKIEKLLQTPQSIAIFSGINAYINFDLMNAYKKQIKVAEENMKKLDAIKARFSEDQAQFCPDGRDDINNLQCYCYNADGSKNTSGRSNSAQCTSLWSVNDTNLFVTPGVQASTDPNTREGCVTESGQFDLNCSCRDEKNDQGKNTCQDVNFASIAPNLPINSYMPLNDMSRTLSSVTEGSFGQNLDTSGLEKQLAASTKVRDGLIKKLENDGQKYPAKNLNPSKVDKLLSTVGLSKKQMAPIVARDPLKGGFSAFDTKVKNALANPKAAMKDPVSALSGKILPSKKAAKRSGSKKKGWDFSMGRSKGKSNKNMKFMDKKYKLKNADIVKDESASIFDIITNRYMKSGYQKLFEE